MQDKEREVVQLSELVDRDRMLIKVAVFLIYMDFFKKGACPQPICLKLAHINEGDQYPLIWNKSLFGLLNSCCTRVSSLMHGYSILRLSRTLCLTFCQEVFVETVRMQSDLLRDQCSFSSHHWCSQLYCSVNKVVFRRGMGSTWT